MLLDLLNGPFSFTLTLTIGLVAYWWFNRGINKSLGVTWAQTKKAIFEDKNVAVAIRAGFQYLAVAIIVAGSIAAGSTI